MTDRELLEFAAKAAGMPFHKWNDAHGYLMVNVGGDTREWNPLTDDGDALRLAVKLGQKLPAAVIGVFNRPAFPYASASIVHLDGAETYIEQDAGEDVAAATRRAIVRAVAEIGKSMP